MQQQWGNEQYGGGGMGGGMQGMGGGMQGMQGGKGGGGMQGMGGKGGGYGAAKGDQQVQRMTPYPGRPSYTEEASQAEVEMFLQVHTVEDHALQKFLGMNPRLQKLVINKGTLLEARDQTAMLMGRMKQVYMASKGQVDTTAMKQGDWICPGCLDHQFAKNEVCRSCGHPRTAAIQAQVKELAQRAGGPGAGSHLVPATQQEVFEFLSQHQIEEKAQQRFLEMDAMLQKLVINKGNMLQARDQTAVLISRITSVSKIASGQIDESTMKEGDWICSGCLDHQFSKNLVCRQCGTPKPQGCGFVAGGNMQQQWNGGQSLPDSVLNMRASPDELEMFLGMCSVDPHAADKLRGLDPCLQAMVISKGSLAEARDQTAMLMGRISKALTLAKTGMSVDPAMMKEGDWICSNCLEHNFGRNDMCRSCGTPKAMAMQNPRMQMGGGQGMQMGQGGQKTTISYNQAGGNSMVTPASEEEVQYFLAGHTGLDEGSVQRFLTCDGVTQKMVMNKGTMADARDQNAVLHSRLNTISRMNSGGMQIDSDKLKPGDWICPNCLDHQFSKNDTCRKCGTPKAAAGSSLQTSFGNGVQLPQLTESSNPQEVQQFVGMHQIEPHAADMLMHLDPKLQKLVINKGTLQGARDQTAMLMGRIKQVNKMASGAVDMNLKPGDWICSGCLDVQFSRNTTCRQCGTPKPSGGQGAMSQGQAWAQSFMG